MRLAACTCIVLLCFNIAVADVVEEWVEESLEPQAIFEWLDDLRERPLDLNAASRSDLQRLPFFDEGEVECLLLARQRQGSFRSMNDVLNLSEWGGAEREVLRQFTTVVPIANGKGIVRAASSVQETTQSSVRARFDSQKAVRGFASIRRRSAAANDLDYASVGIEFRPNERYHIVAGDYQSEFGSGLVFGSAFGAGSWLTRSGSLDPGAISGLKSRPTSNQLTKYRGAGAEMDVGIVSLTAMLSQQQLDAIVTPDGVQSLAPSESGSNDLSLARNNQVEEQLAGAVVAVKRGVWIGGICGSHSRFSPAFTPIDSPDDPFRFSGSQLNVGSVFAGAQFQRIEFSGELARSNPGGIAHQSVVALRGERLGVAAYHASAAPNFFSPHSKSWSGFESEAVNSRRTGVRILVRDKHFSASLHAWSSRTPFRTTTVPLREEQDGLESRVDLKLPSGVNFNLLAGRTRNEGFSEAAGSEMTYRDRLRAEATIPSDVEFKLRLEVRSAGTDSQSDHDQGTLLFLQAKDRIESFWLFLRVTVFNVEGSNVAMTVYENAPLGTFPVESLYDNGRRVAFMLSRDFGTVSVAAKIANSVIEDGANRTSDVEGAAQLSLNW